MEEPLRLTWPVAPGATTYRFELLGPDRPRVRLRQEVSEPAVELEAAACAGATDWRVHAARDGGWTLHVPPIHLGADDPAGHELAWPETGAVAYRVVIRAARSGEVLVSRGVRVPRLVVPWGELGITGSRTYFVQRWADGGWHPLVPATPLLPPPELLLAPRPWGEPAVGLAHVLLVELTARPPGAAHGERRPPAWWRARLDLLAAWTLRPPPAAGERRLVRCAPDVPDADVTRLAAAHPDVVVTGSPDAAAEAVARAGEGVGPLAVTRVLAGDRPHPDLGRRAAEHAAELGAGERAVVRFTTHIELDPEGGAAALATGTAAATTVLLGPGVRADPAGALDPGRPFHDRAYRAVEDAGLAAVLRGRPGPNVAPGLPPGATSLVPDAVRAAFGADLPAPEAT